MAIPVNIEDLLHKRKIESTRIEFKTGWNPDKIYRTICAFANDFDNIGGGYIIVGVQEEENTGIAKRPVTGIPIEELDKIQRDMVGGCVKTLAQPHLYFKFCYIFFWLCYFFLMHLATSCYIPIISGYK